MQTCFFIIIYFYKNVTLKLSYKLYHAFIIYVLLFLLYIKDFYCCALVPDPSFNYNYENIYELIH